MPDKERSGFPRRYFGMRSILLIAMILGACQTATVETSSPASTTASTSTVQTTTSPSTVAPTPTTTIPASLTRASLYPYQSAASIAVALNSPLTRSEEFDWGLDYVKWVVGWDEAISFDGTDGTDQWGTFYRSQQDDVIYVGMRILGYNVDQETVVGIYQATTFFDDAGYDLSVELRETDNGWVLELTPPAVDELELPPATEADVLVQFESASFESPLEGGTTSLRLGDKPESWGFVQIVYRDESGHTVGWHATVIDPSG